jgi:general secretion pathway protein A
MYKKYYGLTRNPFELSPDPYFFFPSPRHNEALATLTYGVLNRKGFVVVTGEVGTGKTLLVRCLLATLDRNRVAFAFIYNPLLSVRDFLAQVLRDFGVTNTEGNKSDLLTRLNNFVLVRSWRDLTTALIVDEAQLLSWELLEEIRLLTNLETTQHKLLQIVLVGQPELDDKLDSQELRQLKQRIGMRCRLDPLGIEESRGYIDRRLELAGANLSNSALFPEETITAIHVLSRGIPRLINTLCENALIAGYGRQLRQITPDMIQEVAGDMRLGVMARPSQQGSDEKKRRKKVVKALSTMIEELGESASTSKPDWGQK